jgi:hypothetical protein
MAKEKTKKKKEENEGKVEDIKPLDENTRFRYIGFDVYGKSNKDFFKSEAEKKAHEEAVQKFRSGHYSPFRSFTAVNQNLLPLSDKIVLTISSLALIFSVFLPWVRFQSSWTHLTFRGLTGIFQASQYMHIINMFNPNLMFFLYVPAVLAFLALIFGVLNLVFLWSSAKSFDAYLKRLKRFMGLGWYVLAGWLAFFVISVIGINLPFGDWMNESYGVRGIGSTVNLITFVSLSGIGVWMSIAAFVLNSVKANDF